MLHRREVIGGSLLALMIVWPLALLGTDREGQEPKAPIASLEVQATRIDWLPKVDYERLDLTVAGPRDFYVRQEFRAGQAPQFSLVTSKGDRLPDGSYTYELRLVPRAGDDLAKKLLVQSGSLFVQGGSFMDLQSVQGARPRLSPPASKPLLGAPPLKDIVQNDDLVVKGHACIGPVCTAVNPGDPTLTLREDLGSFPKLKFDVDGDFLPFANDWTLQANDSEVSSGGPNGDFTIRNSSFSTIPFRIVGGSATPDNSLTVFINGNIGLGTSTPAAPLHLQNRSGNTNTIVALVTSSDGQNLFRIFETTNTGGLMSIFNNAGSETVRISAESDSWMAAAGNVGIGTTSPAKKLTIKSSGGNNDVVQIVRSASTTTLFRVFETTAGDGLFSIFDNTGAEAARFTSVAGGKLAIGCNAPDHDIDLSDTPGVACSAGSARSFIDAGSTTFTASSSRSIKENLAPVQVANILDKISEVGVYNYDFIAGPKDKIGLMAEDFHTIFGRGSDKLLNGQEVEIALWLGVQELTAQNKELSAQNKELRAQSQEINRRLAALEAQLAVERVSVP